MEPICRPPLLSSRPSFPKPFLPKTLTLTPPKTLIPIRASQNPNPNPNPTKTLISSIAKPTIITLTAAAAAAAILLSRHPKPSLASPITQSETLTLESNLKSNPNDISLLRTQMEQKVKSRDLPGAIAIVDRLISLEPNDTDLPILKSHLQSYSGELAAAKAGFEEVVAKDPTAVEAYHGLVMMASQSADEAVLKEILIRIEAAMEVCRREKKMAELKDFNLLVAQVRVIEGKYDEALRIYEELVKEEPKDFRPYLCQGIIYTLMKKKDEAERYFETYRKLVPKEHPYAQFFEQNMGSMMGFSPAE